MSAMAHRRRAAAHGLDAGALRAEQRRFREIFPRRFADPTYLEWERAYKVEAHRLWHELLSASEMDRLLAAGDHREIAARALAVYQRPKLNLLALYEWMGLREALVSRDGARAFAPALRELIYGDGPYLPRFEAFVDTLDGLPQRQTRIAKWPVATLYPFVALSASHLVVKPNLMKRAAAKLGADLRYRTRPNGETYAAVIAFARGVREGLAAWHPRDMIDVQGFLWVTNSDEYADWPWE